MFIWISYSSKLTILFYLLYLHLLFRSNIFESSFICFTFFQSKKEILETVTMVTSSTSERITKNEIKVSGSCWFYTTLPPDEGKYGFLVSVSPGGRHFNMEDKLFTVGNKILHFP